MRTLVGILRDGKWYNLQKGEIPPAKRKIFGQAPAAILDTITPTFCHGTGRTYESRSEMERDLKGEGLAPLGWNETIKEKDFIDEKEVQRDTEEAYHLIKNNNNGFLSEEEKNVCRELDQRLEREHGVKLNPRGDN